MMNKMIAVMACLCFLIGCQKTQAPVSAPIAPQQEQVAAPAPSPQVPEAMPLVMPSMPEDTEAIDEASLQARRAMEQGISRGITQAVDNLTRDAETIIAENRWGFSVYDPATNSIEYYASNGVLLGKRDKP